MDIVTECLILVLIHLDEQWFQMYYQCVARVPHAILKTNHAEALGIPQLGLSLSLSLSLTLIGGTRDPTAREIFSRGSRGHCKGT